MAKTRSKRRNGEGGITYDEARESYRVSITTPAGKRIFKRFKTEAEAVAWKAAQTNAINMGTFIVPSKMTLGEWVVEWLTTYKKGNIKQSTYELYLYLASNLSDISENRLQELQAPQVQKLYIALMDRLSNTTINKVHKLLKDSYNKAFSLGYVSKNIMLDVASPKFEKKEIEIFTPVEIEKILKTCHEHAILKHKYPEFLLAVTTGLRLGEILGLRWCDVDFSAAEIHVRKGLTNTKALGLTLGKLKTKAANRKIAITKDVVKVLKELKSKTINIDIQQKKVCFVTRNDKPIVPRSLERSWEDLLRIAKVPYKNFHVLRHTHATELLAAGVPIIEVARRLGHSKVSHTLELYGHAIPNYDKGIADKVEQLYSVPK